MTKKYIHLLFSFILFPYAYLTAQCEVEAIALQQDIVCGTCVTISAFGQGQGQSVFTENFNTGAPTGWQSTAQATYTNPCSPGGVDGTLHLWMGDATGVPRQMTTPSFNFSTATSGATICFDMLFATQGDASPCEGPDEPDEGVYLQYSIDNGTTWNIIHYFDPDGGNNSSLTNWNNWCFNVPAAALTSSTQFRWFQDNDSGAEYDHWGLDNVNIYFNDPTYNITWSHDGFSYGMGNSGGANPTPVCPQITTTYTVTMSNGTSTCTDQVTINVVPPTFRVDAGNDTSICAGQCADIGVEGTVVVSPAKTPTYENNEVSVLAGLPSTTDLANLLLPCFNFSGCTCPNGSSVSFGQTCPAIFTGSLSMNINITDLNTTILQNGELTSVCLADILMTAGDLSPFQVTLTCPSGSSIILANAGDLTGTSVSNACFDLSSTTPIASGSAPYTGSWQSVQPLSNLSGCTANGVWTLTLSGTFNLSSGTLPIGFLNGWNISFDDPEISYEGDLTWSPINGLSSSTIVPTGACPSATTMYTLTVADTAGCATATDDVLVTVTPTCCNFDISAMLTQPTCSATNGAIDVSITNGSGNYTYNWTSGQGANQDLTGIGAGTYNLTVTDVGQSCSKDTSFTLNPSNGPMISTVNATDATCGNADGSITITASGGTAPLSYSIDGGTTFQAGSSFSNLSANTYNIVVSDANNCQSTSTATINNSGVPSISNVNATDATCGNTDGSINITASGGTAPLSYSIDGGATYQVGNSFSNLSANSYNIVVSDANNCQSTSTATINNNSAPSITNVNATDATCGNSNGSISITASGGTAPLSYSIDGGTTFQAGNSFSNLAANTYNIVVSDANNCQSTSTATINNSGAPSITNVNVTDATCGNSDGSISITASGGTAPLSYSIDGGTTFQAGNSFSNLSANTYNIVVSDANNCETTSTATINNSGAPSISNVNATDATCGNADGSINITASGGTAPLSYSIDGGTIFQAGSSFSNLSANTYNIAVEDANSCQTTSTATINNSGAPSISNVNATDATCGNADGSISITASGGTAPLSYSIDDGITFQAGSSFGNLVANTYNIVVSDANNCQTTSTATINNSGAPSISNVNATDATCGNADGSISITANGGTAPLSYSIDGGATFQASNSFSNLSANTYNIVVSDANICQTTSTATINNSGAPSITNVNATDATCGNADGSISITASGGTAPLSYSIDGGTTFQAGSSFGNLVANTYNIMVSDANNCQTTSTAIINNSGAPSISNVNAIDATCGNADGSISITASGGTAPLSYSIDGGTTFQAGSSFIGLQAGSYSLVVEDASGCLINQTIILQSSSAVDTLIAAINHVECFGESSGSFNLIASGGNTPYQFYVVNGNDTLSNSNGQFTNLIAGDYATWVQDANNCTYQTVITITQPSELILTDSIVQPNCFGSFDGVIFLQASGGSIDTTASSPYVFLLDGETSTSGIFTNLNEDVYSAQVIDANGCTKTILIQLEDPAPIIVSINPEDTSIIITESVLLQTSVENAQGTMYAYNWQPQTGLSCADCSNPIAMPYESTEYTLYFTDENGCTGAQDVSITVNQPVQYFIPNAFTPGGFDTQNEYFEVFGNYIYQINMQVYNRWGEKIFEDNGIHPKWDGTYNGKLQNPGVYSYFVEIIFLNGDAVKETGSITLLR